jgi:thioredoxin reductase (NADPH)
VSVVNDTLDLLIVGAGPIGIACGVEATRAGLSHVIIEKGCLTNAVFRFPAQVVFFSTPELLEIGGVPFITSGPKPTRREILLYYRRVAEHYRLPLRLYERVLGLESDARGAYAVRSAKHSYRARSVVLAIGFYDHPNLLGVPGEDLPKVSHYYTEPHPYYRQQVAVIGGQNSAAEAALDLHRNGARVTLIHRREALGSAIKYWVRPDIENRIKEGSIPALFSTEVVRIDEGSIAVRSVSAPGNGNGEAPLRTLDNDFVLAMTGYHADLEFLERVGIRLEGERRKPVLDPATMETNVERIYVAGVASGGLDTNRIFIENGRVHARLIAEDIARKLGKRKS